MLVQLISWLKVPGVTQSTYIILISKYVCPNNADSKQSVGIQHRGPLAWSTVWLV